VAIADTFAAGPTPPTPRSPLRRRLRRLLRWGLVFGLLGLVLCLAHRQLLVGFASRFRVHDPAPSDALVVLLGQWTVRPASAAELYRRGLSPLILLGTDEAADPEDSETALTRTVLIRCGVPDQAIHVLPGVIQSTQEEAIRVREYAHTHPLRRITVVTNAFHTARARWIFRKALRGMNIDVRMAAAPDLRFDESNWYTREIGRRSYVSELMKTIYYRLAY
jgi:uncharacterized SAM-binding protein YcdF (DUF218 family)